jgi:putative tryptophan/tyrosine transport system substrate-binding protein
MKTGNSEKANVFGFALFAMLFTLCLPAEAQQAKKVPRIGFVVAGFPSTSQHNIDAFRQGLRELGYVEGQNIYIDYRYGEGSNDRLADLTAELVRLQVGVIVTGSTIAVGAAKKATGTIPVVMVGLGDPVGTGLVASLSRPGGNITGSSSFSPELGAKRLELLKETFPRISRVAILFNGANPSNVAALKEIEIAAPALRVQLQPLDVRGADDFESAFEAANRRRANALLVQRDPLNNAHATRIVTFAAKSKLAAMYPGSEHVNVGGLMSYGVSGTNLYRRAATYVDKILKGTKPADLPVEQPKKFEFIINLKAAMQIGLTIPPNVLARADKVIR